MAIRHILWLSVVLLCFTGCVAGSGSSDGHGGGMESTEPLIDENLQFDDIPVPNKFVLLEEDSHMYQTTRVRYGRLIYRGPHSVKNTRNFVEEQFELKGWKPERSLIRNGVYEYFFSKPGEVLSVQVTNTAFFTKIDIRLDLDPTDVK